MANGPSRASLAEESAQERRLHDLARNDLDGDDVAEEKVARLVDGSHPTLPEERLDRVYPLQDGPDQIGGVVEENVAVVGTDDVIGVVTLVASRAELHRRALAEAAVGPIMVPRTRGRKEGSNRVERGFVWVYYRGAATTPCFLDLEAVDEEN
jgi:hypothetical protein